MRVEAVTPDGIDTDGTSDLAEGGGGGCACGRMRTTNGSSFSVVDVVGGLVGGAMPFKTGGRWLVFGSEVVAAAVRADSEAAFRETIGDMTRFCGGFWDEEGSGPSVDEGVVCIGGGWPAALSAICSFRILHTFGTGAGLVDVTGLGATGTAGVAGLGGIGVVTSFAIPFINGDSGLVIITLELGVTSVLAGFEPSFDAVDPEALVEEVVPVALGLPGRWA